MGPRVRLLVLAVLVLLAGCGATGSSADRAATPTVTPAPVPTSVGPAETATAQPTPTLPPGVEDGSVNAALLAGLTGADLDDRSYSWTFDRLESRPEFSLGSTYVGPRVRANVSAPDRYSLSRVVLNARGGGLSIETFENATYVTPDRVYHHDRNGTTVREPTRADEGQAHRLAAGYVRTYLAVDNATVTRFDDGTTLVRGTDPREVNGSDYVVTAVVSPEGVVTSFSVVYSRDGQVRFAEFELERGVAFTPPAWADGGSD